MARTLGSTPCIQDGSTPPLLRTACRDSTTRQSPYSSPYSSLFALSAPHDLRPSTACAGMLPVFPRLVRTSSSHKHRLMAQAAVQYGHVQLAAVSSSAQKTMLVPGVQQAAACLPPVLCVLLVQVQELVANTR